MYSQNDEEGVILKVLGGLPAGRFYDIGAWDGLRFSNTRALLEGGWRGVMVEPSPAAFVGLMANTEAFADRVDLVNVAVTVGGGLVPFFDARGDAVGTLDTAHRDRWEPAVGKMRPIHVHSLPIARLFAKFGPAEFINLDVEGVSLNLYRTLPFWWPELRLICVEHDGHLEEMAALAGSYGFARIHQTAENLLLARRA